jgi:hypothetical protein
MSTVRSSLLIKSNFSSHLIVFRRFLTWIALSDVHLRLPLTFVRTAYAAEYETT